jgi:hypothetical protein
MVHGVTDGGRPRAIITPVIITISPATRRTTFKQQGNDRRPYPEDWPYMGSVVAMKRPQHPSLPSLITLPHKPSKLPFTRPGQFAGRIGMEFDPFILTAALTSL